MADLKNEETKREHQTKTYRKVKRALQVILGALLVLALFLYIKSYQSDGGFLPDTDTQEVKNNQIFFPDDEAYNKNGGGDEGDSDLWEQDEESENTLNPEEIPDSSVLFETQQGNGTKNKAAVANNATPVATTENGEGVVFVAGSGTDGVKITGGTGQATGDGAGSGSGTASGGSSTGGSDSSSEGGNSGTNTKKNYDIADPTPKVESSDWATDKYNSDESSSEQQFDGEYSFAYASSTRGFYYGEDLTEEKILSATEVMIYYDDFSAYQITSYGKNFKIKDGYPKTATEDFSVTFLYRSDGSTDNWEEISADFQVKDYCVIFEGIGEQKGQAVAMAVLDEGETLTLKDYYKYIYSDEYLASPTPLSEIFLGWSETVGGERLDSPYAPSEKGRTILYACDTVPVPEGYTVIYDTWFGHKLTGVESYEPEMDLNVPYGVEYIGMYYYGKDEEGNSIPYKFNVMSIPETMTGSINPYCLLVKTAYEVAEGNKAYSSYAGALYNKDQTELLGVPYGITSLYLPSTVTEVSAVLAGGAKLETLHITSETVPEIDWYTFLGDNYWNCVFNEKGYEDYSLDIYVPESAYYQYLDAWQDAPCVHIKKETGETEDIIIKDGAVLSKDGTILYSVLASTTGIYYVPDTVTQIKDGAFADCDQVTRVVFRSLGTDGAPEIAAGAFGDHTVYVSNYDYDEYLKAWSEALGGVETAKQKIKYYEEVENETTDGKWQYIRWQDETDIVLKKAPAGVTKVDQTVLADAMEGLTVTTIADGAFSGCTDLQYVVLPESVKEIGSSVFSGCTSLQLLYVASEDTLKIGNNNFTDCDALKAIVMNASSADGEEGWADDVYAYIYLPLAAEGYGDLYAVIRDFDSFTIKETGEGYVIYGQADTYGTGKYALIATPDISEMVSLDTDTNGIYLEAFSDCMNAFSLNWSELTALSEIQKQAFAGSGLTNCQIGGSGGSDVTVYDRAFAGSEITSCEIGENTYLNDEYGVLSEDVFEGCEKLKSVTINGGVHYTWNDTGEFAYNGIVNGIFNNCTSLTKVTFGNRDVMIGAEAFSGCTSLTSLTFPDNIMVYLDNNAFGGATSLTTITFYASEVPELWANTESKSYTFGEDLPDSFLVVLSGNAFASQQTYIDTWKYYLLGYDSTDVTLTEEENLKGTNLALALFGLDPLTSLVNDESEEPKTESAGESIPDAQAEQDSSSDETAEEKETSGGDRAAQEETGDVSGEESGQTGKEEAEQSEASGNAGDGESAGQNENKESEQEETP